MHKYLALSGGVLSLIVAAFIGWRMSETKDPASFAYIALCIFAAIPILLLLQHRVQDFSLKTPKGDWQVRVQRVEKQIERMEKSAGNIAAKTIEADPPFAERRIARGTRVRIVDVAPWDLFADQKAELVGRLGSVVVDFVREREGFRATTVRIDDPIVPGDPDHMQVFTFVGVKFDIIAKSQDST